MLKNSSRLLTVTTSSDRLGYCTATRVQTVRQGRMVFYREASSGRKSAWTLVRQLRGPHLRTWAWWSRRSRSAVTAAVSPRSGPVPSLCNGGLGGLPLTDGRESHFAKTRPPKIPLSLERARFHQHDDSPHV